MDCGERGKNALIIRSGNVARGVKKCREALWPPQTFGRQRKFDSEEKKRHYEEEENSLFAFTEGKKLNRTRRT